MTKQALSKELTRGLTEAQVSERRAQYGWNDLPSGKKISAFDVALRQFKSVLVLLLLVAAAIAWFLGEGIDTIAILLVVILNALLGFIQEWRAEHALEALRNMLSPRALVIRDGQEMDIPSRELVPGDVVLLSAGDNVPADLKLISALQLTLDESVLTGESVPVLKGAEDKEPFAFMGTSVVGGRAEGEVTAIGASTGFGQVADLTSSVSEKRTNLQVKLGRLAKQLGLAAILIALAVVVAGLLAGQDVSDMFMTGLSMAVAIVPEGLPAVVTITLALGAAAMVREQALVRRLQAVETLGAASVICTDKTGTLTENKMTASAIWTLDKDYQVTGTGYDPAGHIAWRNDRVVASEDEVLSELLTAATTCNHARLRHVGGEWQMIGEPTEGALETLAYKGWSSRAEHRDLAAELPFSSERKRMSVLSDTGNGLRIYCKGAPERVLETCTDIITTEGARSLSEKDRQAVLDAYHKMASDGLRVIALASGAPSDGKLVEQDLVFLGLVGLIDPPRPEVKGAVRTAKAAGIRVVVITGDSQVTAKAIARQLGIEPKITMNGDEVHAATDEELAEVVKHDVLFARTKPSDKMRIIEAFQDAGQIVAMTGDGVNDAPALKKADIGVSMGIRGTHVAKEASDLVLLDDNFATIVRAITEGRRQFENVKKFVRYLLCSNAGEVLAIMANILIGGPLIFLATQILWMNLITDGVTAVTLGLEKSEKEQMRQPPRHKDAEIMGKRGIVQVIAFGTYTGLASLWIFYQMLPLGTDIARTTAFTAMVVFEKVSVFAFRSLQSPCWRIGWFSNPYLIVALLLMLGAQIAAVYWQPLQVLLRTVPLGWDSWAYILLFAIPLIVVPELIKTLLYRQPKTA